MIIIIIINNTSVNLKLFRGRSVFKKIIFLFFSLFLSKQ